MTRCNLTGIHGLQEEPTYFWCGECEAYYPLRDIELLGDEGHGNLCTGCLKDEKDTNDE